jgi:hypothetical protein
VHTVRGRVLAIEKEAIMSYSVDKKQFATKIGRIKKSTSTMRDEVQDALYAATYLCIAHSGGTTPFQDIFDAVGNSVHRAGIATWLKAFAPVRMAKEKVLLNKEVWSNLDKELALKDFDTFMESIGVNAEGKKWYQIAKESNTTDHVFDPESRVNALLKALDGHEYGTLASYIREAVDKYNAAEDLAAKVVKTMTGGEVIEGEVVTLSVR